VTSSIEPTAGRLVSWTPEESQVEKVESSEHQDNANIHCQSFPESVSEEHEIYAGNRFFVPSKLRFAPFLSHAGIGSQRGVLFSISMAEIGQKRFGLGMENFLPIKQQFRGAEPLTRVIEPNARSKLAKPLTLAAMSLGYGVVQLDVTIVNTALQSISSTLGGGVSELQWVVSTYTIAFAAFILTAGALGDRLGTKKIFMIGFAVFTAASLACALAPTSTILIASRAVQGT
jgi:hypothetical protein